MQKRKLDNTAKTFSLDEKKNNNIYRMTAVLKEKINPFLLKKAVIAALETYPSYKVKRRLGFFWYYFSENEKTPIVERKTIYPHRMIRFRRSNDYLFKVTYDDCKINLEVLHMLTDGIGASIFLKAILYHYLSAKYSLSNPLTGICKESTRDAYLKCVAKEDKKMPKNKKAYLIKKETLPFYNKTTCYKVNLYELKKVCKQKKLSITEFLTALYMYAIYQTTYQKKTKKDIVMNIPIDLRRYWNEESYSNFFTCMCIDADIMHMKKVSVAYLMRQVHQEFQRKLTEENIRMTVAKDVKLGTNFTISAVPLFLKKIIIKWFGKMFSKSSTSTVSNLGPIILEPAFQPYVENIMVIVNPGRIQKVKCTVCSYLDTLTICLNSNLVSNALEKEFYYLLCKYVGLVEVESDAIKV